MENASQEYDFDTVRKLISELQATDKWTFVYLGAGADAWSQGVGLVGAANTVGTTGSAASYNTTFTTLRSATKSYASGQSTGAAVVDFFEEEHKKEREE